MAPPRKRSSSTRKASSTSSTSSTSSDGGKVAVVLAHPGTGHGGPGDKVTLDALEAQRLIGAGHAKAAG